MFTATYSSLRAWPARVLGVLGLLLWALGTPAWGETVASISRSTKTPWVVDGTGALDDEARAELNRLGSEVEQSGLGQLVTVLVATTEGRPSRTFATELFNRWKIGHASRDDGVLLFVALLDHQAEIILGDGVDSPQDVARSEQVMRERIIPALKEGETGEAMLEGARGLKTLLAQSTINAGLKIRADVRVESGTAQARPPAKPGSQEARPPAPEPKEFLDDEGMYVDIRTSQSSEGESAPAASPRGHEPAPSAGPTASTGAGSAGAAPGGDGLTRVTVQSTVPLWVWGVVGIFILLLIVANARRRGRTTCDACGSTNVDVSTTTVFAATDGEAGLDQVTVHCRSCGYVDTFTRDVSARKRSRRHTGTHGGGASSGKGASGSW